MGNLKTGDLDNYIPISDPQKMRTSKWLSVSAEFMGMYHALTASLPQGPNLYQGY